MRTCSPLGNPTGFGDSNFGVKYNFYQERYGSRLPAFCALSTIQFRGGIRGKRKLGARYVSDSDFSLDTAAFDRAEESRVISLILSRVVKGELPHGFVEREAVP